jgi:NitT/TauT family transport system ATP-binding protein
MGAARALWAQKRGEAYVSPTSARYLLQRSAVLRLDFSSAGRTQVSPQTMESSVIAATARMHVAEAHKVSKVFDRGGVLAVDSVSFTMSQGEFVSVVGPSGCGKSTLLRMVAGLIEKTSGQIQVHGTNVSGPRADTSMMFQKPTLLPWKTALENVLLPLRISGKLGDGGRARALDALNMVGLDGFDQAYPRHLSGGMQQRVALARLLVTGADLLLLDEPFGALDEFTRESMNIELQRIQSEIDASVMFVTHNISEAVFLADRVFVMTPRPGRLAGIVDVPFPRPRTIATMKEPEFVDLVYRVRAILGEGA